MDPDLINMNECGAGEEHEGGEASLLPFIEGSYLISGVLRPSSMALSAAFLPESHQLSPFHTVPLGRGSVGTAH